MRHLMLLLVLLTLTSRTDAAPIMGADNAQPIALSYLSKHCIEFAQVKVGSGEPDAMECVVMDFGVFGKRLNQTYYYALYCLTPNSPSAGETCAQRRQSSDHYRTDGLAIFVQDGNSPNGRPLLDRAEAEIGMYNYGRPAFISGMGGEFMVLPIQLTGTGNGNASEYYSWEGNTWQPLDAKAWLVDLGQRLPEGLEIWKGVWPEMHSMRAIVPLYQRKDGNCCPTGGTALVELAVTQHRFTLKSVQFMKERIDPKMDDSAFRRNWEEVTPTPRPTPTPVPVVYPSLQQPLTISSWAGNGFGVVGELTGQYRIDGDRLTIKADTLKLRQVNGCPPHCETIKSVAVEIYGDSGATSFYHAARSAPLPVGKTFEGRQAMLLGSQVFEMTLPAGLHLEKLWLGLNIENSGGGTYYAHTDRHFFARALQTSGVTGDPCADVKDIGKAIESRCHQVLERELDRWYRPLTTWWNKVSHGPPPVFIALHESNLEAIRLLGAHGIDMDMPDPSTGDSPLMIAAANGNVAGVQALLNAGANVKYAVTLDNPQRGRTALNSALYADSEETIKILLLAGATVDKPDRHGWLPVHYAAYYDHPTSLALLKAHHASLEASTTTERGETPLMLAAQYGKLGAIRYLLTQAVNTAAQDHYGKNAYDYAVFFKQATAMELLKP